MDVNIKTRDLVRFGDLQNGDTFLLNYKAYICIDLMQRAVCLHDGKTAIVMESTLVSPIKLKCVEV